MLCTWTLYNFMCVGRTRTVSAWVLSFVFHYVCCVLLCARTRACVCMYVCACTCTCVHMCVHVCVCVYIHVCACVDRGIRYPSPTAKWAVLSPVNACVREDSILCGVLLSQSQISASRSLVLDKGSLLFNHKAQYTGIWDGKWCFML